MVQFPKLLVILAFVTVLTGIWNVTSKTHYDNNTVSTHGILHQCYLPFNVILRYKVKQSRALVLLLTWYTNHSRALMLIYVLFDHFVRLLLRYVDLNYIGNLMWEINQKMMISNFFACDNCRRWNPVNVSQVRNILHRRRDQVIGTFWTENLRVHLAHEICQRHVLYCFD